MVALLLVQLVVAGGHAAADHAKAQAALASEDYERGRYAAAAREWQEADRLSPRVNLLLKVAKAWEKAGELAKAAEAYRAFLRRSPGNSNRAAIKREIARLSKEAKRRRASLAIVPLAPAGNPLALVPLARANPLALEPLAPHTAEPPPPEGPPAEATASAAPVAGAVAETAEKPHKSVAPVLLTTLGAVAVAGAAGCGYWGGWGLDAMTISQHNQGLAPPAEKATYNSEIGTYQLQAGVWLAAAAVLGATGIYFLVTGPSWGSSSGSTEVSAAPMAGGGGLVWSGSFQ